MRLAFLTFLFWQSQEKDYRGITPILSLAMNVFFQLLLPSQPMVKHTTFIKLHNKTDVDPALYFIATLLSQAK
jgi:hypothetical protein